MEAFVKYHDNDSFIFDIDHYAENYIYHYSQTKHTYHTSTPHYQRQPTNTHLSRTKSAVGYGWLKQLPSSNFTLLTTYTCSAVSHGWITTLTPHSTHPNGHTQIMHTRTFLLRFERIHIAFRSPITMILYPSEDARSSKMFVQRAVRAGDVIHI